jgi:hypothetical protein
MRLQFSHLLFLVVFLICLGHNIIDIGIDISDVCLTELDLIDKTVLFLYGRPHLFLEGLKLQSDVMNIII